jgi:hypothetical protein
LAAQWQKQKQTESPTQIQKQIQKLSLSLSLTLTLKLNPDFPPEPCRTLHRQYSPAWRCHLLLWRLFGRIRWSFRLCGFEISMLFRNGNNDVIFFQAVLVAGRLN